MTCKRKLLILVLAFSSLFHFVKCNVVNVRQCCTKSEMLVNGSCTFKKGENNLNNKSSELFLQFLTEQSNLINLDPKYNTVQDFGTTLRLTHQPISCSNGTSTVIIHRKVLSNNTKELLLSESNQTLKLFPTTGYLRHGDNYFHPEEYCINKISPSLDHLEIVVCNPESCSEKRPCIPKCCDIDQVWDLSLYPDQGPIRCRPSGKLSWVPSISRDLKSKRADKMYQNSPRIVISHPKTWCRGEVNIYPLKSSFKFAKRDIFKILPDGKVWIKQGKWSWSQLSPGTFCLDGGINFEEDENSTFSFSGSGDDTVLVDCTDRVENNEACHSTPGATDAYAVSLIVASAFLLVTILVYILLWEKQNVHGFTSLAYFASMFGMYIFTALRRLDYLMFFQNEMGYGCFAIAIGTHFFWLATFCWMSCVNFDVWWTFRALLPTGGKSKGLKRFLIYTIFSLGIPSVIVGVAIILDYLYKNDIENELVTPEYGKVNCFMDQQFALLPYLYGPIAVLLGCNLIFFTVTIYAMHKIQQSTKFASMSSSKNPKQKQSILLFAKLFLLMGIPWAFEMVSWATTPCGKISWYWAIFDYINIFQAVAIFLTFVCKSETINSLEAKFPKFKRFMKIFTISQETSEEFLARHPNLKCIVRPFTRKTKNLMPVSSSKTVSTGVDSSKASTSHRNQFRAQMPSDPKDIIEKRKEKVSDK